ncbi:TetR/AcrR family transcriptional regulator [Actinoallomurus sp. CA-150999]|uniref:TetR/AcrR family transcriptional regulator n=1 Tax=Actinoallomurus sp. CA-150999 TaxID=3239887 RepID=UPI003D8E043B
MITKGERTSARLVESMLELMQARGYSGTGLNTVVEHSGAPKGSLYFHFPEGKEALGEKAVELAADRFRTLFAETAGDAASPGELLRRVVDVLIELLTDSDFQLGCPVSVVALEMGAHSERLRTACAVAFESWIGPVTEYLVGRGHPRPAARSLATAVVSGLEGAMIVSRARRDVEALHSAAQVLGDLVDQPPAGVAKGNS